MFPKWSRKFATLAAPVVATWRYFLTHKVLRSFRLPSRQDFTTMAPMDPSPSELLTVCEQAARAGAAELLAWRTRFQTRQKAARDLVTDADLASEKAVRRVITQRFPDHGILGEEAPTPEQLNRPFCWVVDPLDGTTNYAHRNPCYCVSVAV